MSTQNLTVGSLKTVLKFRTGYSYADITKNQKITPNRGDIMLEYMDRFDCNAPRLTENQLEIGNALKELYLTNSFAMYMCSAGPGTGKTTTLAFGISRIFGMDSYRSIHQDSLRAGSHPVAVEVLNRGIVCIGATHSTCINLRKSLLAAAELVDVSYVKNKSKQNISMSKVNIMTARRFGMLETPHTDAISFLGDINARGKEALKAYKDIGIIIIDEYQTLGNDDIMAITRVAQILDIPLAVFGDPKQSVMNHSGSGGMMKQWSIPVSHPKLYRVELNTTFRMTARLNNSTNIICNSMYSGRFAPLESVRKNLNVIEGFDNRGLEVLEVPLDTEAKIYRSVMSDVVELITKSYRAGINVGVILDNLGGDDLGSYTASHIIKRLDSDVRISRVRESNFVSVRSVKFVEVNNCPGHEFDVVIFITAQKCSLSDSSTPFTANKYYTAITRAKHHAKVIVINPETLYRQFRGLTNDSIEFYTNNRFEFNRCVEDWELNVSPKNWLLSTSLCKPNEQSLLTMKRGAVANGCGISTDQSTDASDIPLVYGKRFEGQLFQEYAHLWNCPPEPIRPFKEIPVLVGAQHTDIDSIYTFRSPIYGIVAAFAYGKRYARIYGDSEVVVYDVSQIDREAFMWLTLQLQCIDFKLRSTGSFVDTEFYDNRIDEICVVDYETPFNSKFFKIGKSTNGSCFVETIPRITTSGIVYYYAAAVKDLELLNYDDSVDVASYVGKIASTGYFQTNSPSMRLECLYHVLCGVTQSHLLHTAAYDAVLLSEIYTRLEELDMI